jgi:hypothetical protein
MTDEEDTHTQLVKAYLEYFKAHEAFESRPGTTKRREARRWLSVIRKLALKRRNEIMETHLTKFFDGRAENWKNTLKARQKRMAKRKSDNT